jgi:enterochelin esterase-like enzyme
MSVEIPFQPLAIDQSDVRYAHVPDSQRRHDVTAGETTEARWVQTGTYPGIPRRFWVHVPARYDPAVPAHLAVFQDGWWYLDPDGQIRGAIVLDNLVDRAEIPVTVGVFIDPGEASQTGQRNLEYDAFDERYASLLADEILPWVSARWSISSEPQDRLICGGSSGGNCALTAAWLRPDLFGHVITFLASFAQMPNGNPYPTLIADSAPKPLKVLMQAGHRDLGWNRSEANWFAENLRVAAALACAGYDIRLVVGDGGHTPNHGGVLLPDALRWHWGGRQA